MSRCDYVAIQKEESSEDKIELLREAWKDMYNEVLSEKAFIVVVGSIIFPQPIWDELSPEIQKWAMKTIANNEKS